MAGRLDTTQLTFKTVSLTDVGLVRKNNEDSLFALDKRGRNALGAASFGIYLIADGMGGHRAGEVASKMASSVVSSFLLENMKQARLEQSPVQLVRQAIEKANSAIWETAAGEPGLSSMGTTLTLGFRLDDELYIGHVGDSRAYLVRGDKILRLTEDHSLVAALVKEGAITPAEAKSHPDSGKILRSLGTSGTIEIDNINIKLQTGDVILFCSDGLTASVSDAEILACLKPAGEPGNVCKKLVALANSRGGGDNTSVIVVNVIPIAFGEESC
jgi:protein phosphatase